MRPLLSFLAVAPAPGAPELRAEEAEALLDAALAGALRMRREGEDVPEALLAALRKLEAHVEPPRKPSARLVALLRR